jgi:transglutaminase-like putative cysteine protease
MTPRSFPRAALCLGALLLATLPANAEADKAPAKSDKPRSRTFQFTYSATVTGLKPGQEARVWVPVPQSAPAQDVTVVKTDLPAKPTVRKEKQYGNAILSFEAKANKDGKIPLTIVYRVTRREVRGELDRGLKESAAQLARLLQPDRLVPVDGKPLDLIKDEELPMDPMAKARKLYDVVNEHMRYSKEGTGWGRGDAAWACDSRHGNCSDFHSLFISLARSQKIPAKFEIGFPLPDKRGEGDIPGYHCWAFFKPKGKGWVPVDISEANKNPKMRDYYFGNLTPDRVAFSVGRDITLVPKQAGKPVNFLIYPYVESGGKEVPQDRVQKKFTFKDLK